MTTITPELKTFMNDLWGAEGDFIDVGTKSGMRLFSALELFDMEAGRP